MRYLIILIFFGTQLQLQAQDPKFGKVNIEELQQEQHNIDQDASAAILFQRGERYLEYSKNRERFMLITKVYKKLKVYKDEGKSYGDVSIPIYRDGSSREIVSELKAAAYNLEDGEIVRSKLDKSEVFTEEESEYWFNEKFAIPNVKNGSIIEYSYKITSPYTFQFPTWYFQYDIPVDKSIYKISYPEYYEYKITSTGEIDIDVDKQVKGDQVQLAYRYDTSPSDLVTRKEVAFENVAFSKNVITYTSSDVPALKREPYILHPDMYRSSLKLELKSTRFPRGGKTDYTKSWNNIAEIYDKRSSFGGVLRKNYKELNELVDEAKAMEPKERMEYIYTYFQSNFTWNNTYGTSASTAKTFFKEGKANVATINLVMINIMKKAGLDAIPIVTRSRNRGVLNTFYPTLSGLNYVFAVVVLGETESYFLDATEKALKPGELPLRALNVNGVAMMEGTAQVLSITNPNISKQQVLVNVKMDEDLNIICESKKRMSDIAAYRFRLANNKMSNEDEFMEKWEKENENVEYSSLEILNWNDKMKSVELNSTCTIEGDAEEVGNKIFMKVLPGREVLENPFQSPTRSFPIFYPHKIKDTYVVMFEKPEGYIIESMPEALNIALPEKMASYNFSISETDTNIQITSNFSTKTAFIPAEYYDAIRNFYDLMINKQNEKIVLVKG